MQKNVNITRWIYIVVVNVCAFTCSAQTIENPLFERSDVPAFYIKKVDITKDTTYVFCQYFAELGSWASISKETFLRDTKSHKTYPLLKCDGLPYSPETRSFSQNESYEILFCFPSIVGINQFDFIENESEKTFNIYGVNLKKSCKTAYKDMELERISEMVSAYNSYSGTKKIKLLKKYATSLINLVSYNVSLGKFDEAVRLAIIEAKIRGKVFGKATPIYIESLKNLIEYHTRLEEYNEAIRLAEEVTKVLKQPLDPKDSYYYVLSLNHLANYNFKLGCYTDAVQLQTEAVEISKRSFGSENINYAISLGNLALYNSKQGNDTKAIEIETETMNIFRKILGTNHPDYALSLNNLALYNAGCGNYVEAIRLGTEASEILKRVIGTNNLNYSTSLSNLALCNSKLGNYSEAIRLGTETMEILKSVLGTETPEYATCLDNLATYQSGYGNCDEAIRLGAEAMEIRKRVLGTNHPDYATSLNNLATFNADHGCLATAIKLKKEAIEISEKVLGVEHPSYATALSNLAGFYSSIGNYVEAIRLDTEVVEIRKRVLGTEHPDFAMALSNLADSYSKLGNYEKAFNYIAQQIECSHDYILKNLGELSSNYQKSLWTTQFSHAYLNILPNLVSHYMIKESISELYNKTCLFAKGILLNTGIEMRKLILESNDSSLIHKYTALLSNINIYNKLIENPIKERFMNSDSLNNVIQKQEMELARESKAYGDHTRNLIISWKDVQQNLEDNDIAIEFLDFPQLGTRNTMYVALTLKKGYDTPHMVTLFEKNQLKAILEDNYYTNTDLYNLVWKSLEEELKGTKNIYFAPSGELHRIGIEYLPISKTKNICDVYTLQRLSSIRQLAVIRDETEGNNAILYGGINYDEKSNATSIDSVCTKEVVLRSAFNRANVDSMSLRSSFEYLEGTKREADMIAEDMKQHHVSYIYYNGINGTEESFKKLDGTKPKLMHIATHGFYLTEVETEKSKFARPQMGMMTNERLVRPVEDKPMTRSGLLFSGCNHAIHHEQIPDGEEDGILTAQEISTLDLRGLELVVLSACQTGLGDIISGEGVFGLQRGFKKAGAKTILMSLSKVDDEATRILMVEFYRNLMNGKTKHRSLRDAQKYLRSVDNGKYDDPKNWASFIMLDGLN